MSYRAWVCGVAVLLAASGVGRAERIVLKGGAELRAEILKRDSSAVFVDLGPTVLRLPREKIATIEGDDEPQVDQPATRPSSTAPSWRLYRTGELERTTIETAAEKFAEAVVLVSNPQGKGSGFFISSDGHLITNYHVISGETQIKVTVFRKSEGGFEQTQYDQVRIVALNPFVDLALLKIEEADETFPHVYLGDASDVEAGQQCFAIGNPLGLTRSVSQGIVSTKNRNFEGRLYIQTTTDINPGNSGGPLFNLRGEVIGVTSMGYVYLGGLNFAIPVDVVKTFVRNRDAFAYDEDNPNSGYRYLQPGERKAAGPPPDGELPSMTGTGQRTPPTETGYSR